MSKYENWSKVLIEPSSLNDARLFALETRIHQEEDIRVREYEYVRDLLKKLMFSLQQNVPEVEAEIQMGDADEKSTKNFSTLTGGSKWD